MMDLEEIGNESLKLVNEVIEEINERAEELKAFCFAFQEELKKSVHKPTFVVPKTPVAKRLRRIKSRKNENAVQQTEVEVRTTRETRSTRSTRNIHAGNTVEIINEASSRQSKKNRSTYKNADIKIEDESESTNDAVRVSEGRKRTHEGDSDDQEAPRKTRRVGKTRATNKGSSGSENKVNMNDSTPSVVAKITDVKSAPIKKKNLKSVAKSDFEEDNKGNSKNESITDSTVASQGSSDPDDKNKSDNQRPGSALSADLFHNVENEVEHSVYEESHVSNASTSRESSNKHCLKEHKIMDTTVTIASSTEGNTSIVNKSLDNEKNTYNIPANSTFVSSIKLELIEENSPMETIKQKDVIQRPAFSPIVKVVRLSPSEVKILTDVTNSSNIKKANKKVPADAHPKTVFSPYAGSPVKDRVAAFEKLKNERERLVQQAALKAAEGNAQPVRMTRTKAKALAAAAAQTKEQQADGEKKVLTSVNKTAEKTAARLVAEKSLNRAKRISLAKEKRELEITPDSDCGKENSMNSCSTSQLSSKGKSFTSASKKYKTTPLLSNSSNLSYSGTRNPGILSSSKLHYNVVNGFVTGVESLIMKPAKIVGDDLEKRKEEIRRRMEKEEEAKKKKEELLRARTEEKKRKREEKMQKAQQAREVLEKEKLEMQMRLKKEKEEKDKLMLQEREKLKEQNHLRKQQMMQQKAAEMEERRKVEEAARRAKIKEQEEEQQRLQVARKREQEEHQRHLAEEREAALLREQQAKLARLKELAQIELKEKEAKQKMAKEKMKAAAAAAAKPPVLDKTFEVSHSSKTIPALNGLVNPNDYGIDECVPDSTDDENDENNAKRPIPLWARKEVRKYPLEVQFFMPAKLLNIVFSCEKSTPNILEMFDHLQRVKRTSSAIWRTPPRLSTLPKL